MCVFLLWCTGAVRWGLFEQVLILELTRVAFEDKEFDIDELCCIISKLGQARLKDAGIHLRGTKEISKQVFLAIATDNAYQKLLKEQLRMNCA